MSCGANIIGQAGLFLSGGAIAPAGLWVQQGYGFGRAMGPMGLWVQQGYGSVGAMGPAGLLVQQGYGSSRAMGPVMLWVRQGYGCNSAMGPAGLWVRLGYWSGLAIGPAGLWIRRGYWVQQGYASDTAICPAGQSSPCALGRHMGARTGTQAGLCDSVHYYFRLSWTACRYRLLFQ